MCRVCDDRAERGGAELAVSTGILLLLLLLLSMS